MWDSFCPVYRTDCEYNGVTETEAKNEKFKVQGDFFMLTLTTAVLFIAAVISGSKILSYGLMIWFLIVGLSSIRYILRWNKKKNARRKAYTAALCTCQAAEKAERRVA